jgi:hypothetical protein
MVFFSLLLSDKKEVKKNEEGLRGCARTTDEQESEEEAENLFFLFLSVK